MNAKIPTGNNARDDCLALKAMAMQMPVNHGRFSVSKRLQRARETPKISAPSAIALRACKRVSACVPRKKAEKNPVNRPSNRFPRI